MKIDVGPPQLDIRRIEEPDGVDYRNLIWWRTEEVKSDCEQSMHAEVTKEGSPGGGFAWPGSELVGHSIHCCVLRIKQGVLRFTKLLCMYAYGIVLQHGALRCKARALGKRSLPLDKLVETNKVIYHTDFRKSCPSMVEERERMNG